MSSSIGEEEMSHYEALWGAEVSRARRSMGDLEIVDYIGTIRQEPRQESPGIADAADEYAQSAPTRTHPWWAHPMDRVRVNSMPDELVAYAPTHRTYSKTPGGEITKAEPKVTVYSRKEILGVLASLDEEELQGVGNYLKGFMGSEIFDHIVSGVHDKAKQDKVATWQAYGGKSAEHGKRCYTEYVGTFMGDFSAQAESADDS